MQYCITDTHNNDVEKTSLQPQLEMSALSSLFLVDQLLDIPSTFIINISTRFWQENYWIDPSINSSVNTCIRLNFFFVIYNLFIDFQSNSLHRQRFKYIYSKSNSLRGVFFVNINTRGHCVDNLVLFNCFYVVQCQWFASRRSIHQSSVGDNFIYYH